jgi:hypothetical protein
MPKKRDSFFFIPVFSLITTIFGIALFLILFLVFVSVILPEMGINLHPIPVAIMVIAFMFFASARLARKLLDDWEKQNNIKS